MKELIKKGKRWAEKLTSSGKEVLDDTPIAAPLRLTRPPSRIEDMRLLLSIVERQRAERGHESFEEADDFDVGDDYDPRSPHELAISHELEPHLSPVDEDPSPASGEGSPGAAKREGGDPPADSAPPPSKA
ncbi:hypothetical protein [Apis mellifera associated microvirus 46]|nr:hypothetical protein [Apis mellifera associated microvirus 46]